MSKVNNNLSPSSIITEHLDTWTQAIETKSSAGRGSSNKFTLVGIKKLRELILEMAVRGLLVPQDSNDEPANVLLEKVAAEKVQLIKDGKIKKTKALPAITDEEKPFDLPNGWEWIRLNDISADIHYGYTASANHNLKDIRLLRITDIQDDKVDWESVPGCEIEPKQMASYLLENNDILIARTGGTVGKSYLVKNISVQSVFASYLIRVKRLENAYSDFTKVFLGSQLYWIQLIDSTSGTGQPNVNGNALKALKLSLPPLNEQKRIVAKVDELMALCDQLEQQTLNSIEAHQTLVETLLNELVNPNNNANISPRPQGSKFAGGHDQAWSLIAENFDVLFITEKSIDTLKQTILQLAVMGKLVPQNPNDEPASELLKKIATEKAQLIKDKKIKKTKPLPEITEEEKPFDLPSGWSVIRLKDLVSILGDGIHGTPSYDEKGGYFFVNGNNLIDESIQIKLDTKKVNKDEYEKHKNPLCDRTVLVSINGTLGRVGFYAGENVMLGKSACYFNLLNGVDKFFISKVLQAPYFQDYAVVSATGSTIKNLSLKSMNHFVIYLPPLEEQTHIVSKVNELMTLCDQLKTQLQTAQQTQTHLAQSISQEAIGCH